MFEKGYVEQAAGDRRQHILLHFTSCMVAEAGMDMVITA
jgi:hypothetical protein